MPKKLTTAEFIERACAKHGDKYDYSKTVYRSAHKPVTIICPEHGEFQQMAAGHYRYGCKRCAGRGRTTAEFIERARAVHGDKYDYSKSAYGNNNRQKLVVECPEHGPFSISPSNHLYGRGCRICGIAKRAAARTSTSEQFIEEARRVHGDWYDYSEVEYLGKEKEVCIRCPEHGWFMQKPSIHRMGCGCFDCGLGKISKKKRKTLDYFLERARAIHGDRYDYSKADYRGKDEGVVIICKEHGEFRQTPHSHVSGKSGCPACGGVPRYGRDGFIERAKMAHGDKYDYSQTKYTSAKVKVRILCPDHGTFLQEPQHHIVGIGCPSCARYGFDSSKTGRLYYLRVADRTFGPLYKIGITNLSVFERFRRSDLDRITIVGRWEFAEGTRAMNGETTILRAFSEFKFNGAEILSSGNSELFTRDVLGLDPQSPESPHPILQEILQDAVEIPADQED